MSDIVKRLRGQEPLNLGDRLLCADEIDRLSAENEELKHDIARHVAICAEQANENDRLRAEVERKDAALHRLRRTHHVYGGLWYSCPKSDEGPHDIGDGDDCNCGADKANAIIDAALAAKGE